VLYHQFQRQAAKADLAKREAELTALKKAHNISDEKDA
jgi:pre-mRNA branch site protein p14